MKLLLTYSGVTNPSIHAALVGMLDRPIAESRALCIPTAMYGHPMAGPGTKAWQFISGTSENPMVDLGWKSVGVLELTALPSIDADRWVPLVEEADVLLVAGGDVLYSGLLDAPVGADRPAAVAGGDGVGGAERREHGDDPRGRRGLHPVEATDR